jgi:hypothetical protein
MHKAILWDKSVLFVEDDKVDALERLMGTQRKARINHLGNPKGDVLMGTGIARVTVAAYREYQHMLPRNDKMIEAPKVPEITDEQRAANLVKLAEIRKNFVEGKYKKPKEANNVKKTNESSVRREIR